MNESELTVTTWVCPICGQKNKDVYVLSAEPSCEQCFYEPGWEDILTPGEQRALNAELKKYTEGL